MQCFIFFGILFEKKKKTRDGCRSYDWSHPVYPKRGHPGGTPEGTRDIIEQTPSSRRLAAVHRTARAVPQGALPRAKMRSSGRYARRDSGHYGANAVQPAFGGSPPDCRIELFESLHVNKKQVVPFGDDLLFGTAELTKSEPSSCSARAVSMSLSVMVSAPSL